MNNLLGIIHNLSINECKSTHISLGKRDFQTTYIRELFFTYRHKLYAKKPLIEPSGKINLAFTRTIVQFLCPMAIYKITLKHIQDHLVNY